MKNNKTKSTIRLLNVLALIFPGLTGRIAFRILSRVRRVPISEEGQLFFSKGETELLEIDGCQTVLHKWGRGPKTVLFLHGWMSHSQRWRNYVAELDPDSYTCYALDAPGHGASDGNSLNLETYRQAYEQTLKITGKVDVLVCHSFGNLTAAYHYLYRPEAAVESYVVMGSPSGLDAIFTYFVEVIGLSPSTMRSLTKKVDKEYRLPHPEIQMEHFFNLVDRPVLVIHEETDTVTPIQPIREAIARNSSIKTLFTEGLDHTLKGPETLKAVTDFIHQQTKEENYVLERV